MGFTYPARLSRWNRRIRTFFVVNPATLVPFYEENVSNISADIVSLARCQERLQPQDLSTPGSCRFCFSAGWKRVWQIIPLPRMPLIYRNLAGFAGQARRP